MGAEGVIAITAGLLAGSIALVAFGLDSAIEGVASLVIVWRFTGGRLLSHAAEERAQKLVAIQFFILAPLVTFEAVRNLVGGAQPEISVLGMVLTATSLVGMPSWASRSNVSPATRILRNTWRRCAEPALCLSRGSRIPRPRRQRAVRTLVAGPDRRPCHRRGRRPRRHRVVARRRVLCGSGPGGEIGRAVGGQPGAAVAVPSRWWRGLTRRGSRSRFRRGRKRRSIRDGLPAGRRSRWPEGSRRRYS